jgi:MFS family permease
MLVPLYLLMVSDLHLRGVSYASAIVTANGLVYCALSYGAGVLADRFDRRMLLGVGLLGNALAIAAMGLTRQYELIMACGIIAGLFGTLYHPSANALVPAHYPKSPGMAIGLLGIGSGIGFFAGPQFAGWRAQHATWHWGSIGDWQRPLIEAGAAGVIVAILFLLFAREAEDRNSSSLSFQPAAVPVDEQQQKRRSPPLGPVLRWRMTWLAAILGFRDFAGVACLSLASIYLQKAHHLDANRTGFILGAMMLVSIVVSPMAVYLSPGRRRLPVLIGVLICGGIVVATVPLWSVHYALPVLMIFMTFQLGSYALSDAAMLERVPANVRGRVVGLFLTIAGTFSSIAPWVMGWWTDHLHDRALHAGAYLPLFATLGAMMILATAATPLLHRLGPVQGPSIDPMTEITPRTAEPAL